MIHSDWISIKETAAPDWGAMPVDLETAKAHLRVSGEDEDDLIEIYIKAATSYAEKYTGYALAKRSFEQTWDKWPGRCLALRWGGVDVDTIEVNYFDVNGDETELTGVITGTSNGLTRIYIPETITLPELEKRIDAIKVTYTAMLTDVPEDIISAILLLIGDLYEKRTDTVKRLPSAVTWLLDQHRIMP